MKKDGSKDAGYWNKERCREEAQKYSNTTDFNKSNPYVYGKAYKMGWLSEICSHMTRLKAPYGYWNSKELCVNEGRKYETRTAFARNSPTAYQKCLENGWEEAFSEMRVILDYTHSYEKCAAIALSCKSQAEMQRNHPKEYSYASSHHFLKEIFSHLPKLDPVTIESAKDAAAKCKLRQEFRIRFPREYRYVVTQHLLDEVCKDMLKMHDMSKRCVYAFEFPDNHVYVGLTCNVERREREHRNETNSSVNLHIQETGLNPKLYIKHDYVDYIKAKELEGEILRDYQDKGWVSLNRTGTGGIGCRGTIYSQIRACTERIKYCEDFKQFEERFPDAYRICFEHDWFDILEEYLGKRKGDIFIPMKGFRKTKVPKVLSADFIERMKDRRVSFWYKDEELFEIGSSYSTRNEFDRKNNIAYRQAKKRGIVDKLFPTNPRLVPNEKLIFEASKYSSREEFKNGSNTAYQMALRRHLLDDLCKDMPYHGYKDEHTMLAAENRKVDGVRIEGYKYWTEEKIYEEIKTKGYQTMSEFHKGSAGAYDSARDMNILDKIREEFVSGKTMWTDEMLANEASNYKSKTEFRKGSPKAYDVAWKRGILDKICLHMVVLRTKWTYEMLAAEARKYEYRGDFYKGSRKAYDVAHKWGILDEICSHMKSKR